MLNYARIYADELGGLCQPGEEVVDIMSALYNAGREMGPNETETASFDPINGVDVSAWNDSAAKLVGGVTLDTRRGHAAAGMARSFRSGSNLVLTTRKLMVIGNLAADAIPDVSWEGVLASVAALTHDPRPPLEWGRLRVDFADGSMVRLWGGLLLPFAARRFVTAFRRTAGR